MKYYYVFLLFILALLLMKLFLEELISLDRLLVRPRGVLYQVICSEMDFVKVARIIQSLIIFFIAISHLNIEWNIINILLIIAMFLSSIILFFGIFLLMASYCFITIHGLEVRNLLTDGGKQMAQYPIGIFRKVLYLYLLLLFHMLQLIIILYFIY